MFHFSIVIFSIHARGRTEIATGIYDVVLRNSWCQLQYVVMYETPSSYDISYIAQPTCFVWLSHKVQYGPGSHRTSELYIH
jgi:hypothetical protein